MIILGIDTSCDDTCIAIIGVKSKRLEIKSNIVSSQIKIHRRYGGVFPTLAKREHRKNLPIVFKKAISKAKNPKIDLIAATIGPGLEPCLWEGINFAKNLAKKLNLPIVPVNHIEAHIFSNFLSHFQLLTFNIFPAICLVVSGGHTQLIFMERIGKYKLLGETRDDAAGECFDKVARLLELGYPGGPAIEKFAKYKIRKTKYNIHLPRPMMNQKNYEFSFAGLKTAVLYDFQKRPKKASKLKQYKVEMAKEIQQTVVDVLVRKTIKAVQNIKSKTILIGGGVAANEKLRRQFVAHCKVQNIKCRILIPKKEFCTDNAVMVAVAGYCHRFESTRNFDKIRAKANLKI